MEESIINTIKLITVVFTVVVELLLPTAALARKQPEQREIPIVKLSDNSIFGEINSYVENIEYDSIFSEKKLAENGITKNSRKSPKSVFDNMELLKAMIYEGPMDYSIGTHDFSIDSMTTLVVLQCHTSEKSINDVVFDIERWNYCLPIGNKYYLFEKNYKSFFKETNQRIEIHSIKKGDKFRWEWAVFDMASWYFIIKDNTIDSIYIVFHYGCDENLNPVFDLFNNKFLRYYVNDIKDSGTKEKTPSDHGHCVSGQDCQALAEQRVPEGGVFISVEQMPQFPGGEAELLKYVSDHLVYPEEAKKNGIQGRVVIQFVVLADGSIGEVKVARGKSAELDKAAVEVVKNLPKFMPGLLNGRPVAVWYTLPVIFKLPQE